MPNTEIIEKARLKRLYKVYGKLWRYGKVDSYGFHLVLWKGKSRKECKLFDLRVSDFKLQQRVLEMIESSGKVRFCARFSISTVDYCGKLYTNLILEEIEEWKVKVKGGDIGNLWSQGGINMPLSGEF